MKHLKKAWRAFFGTKHKSHRSLFAFIVLLVVLPTTVIVAQQQQLLIQEASETELAAAALEQGYVPGSVIVKYKKNADIRRGSKKAGDRAKKRKGRIKRRLQNLPIEEIEIPPGQENAIINELQQEPDVQYVARNAYVKAAFVPNDPDYSKQYGFKNKDVPGADIGAEAAWDVTKGGGVKVAVLDTGIDEEHPELKGKVVARKNFAQVQSAAEASAEAAARKKIAEKSKKNTKKKKGKKGKRDEPTPVPEKKEQKKKKKKDDKKKQDSNKPTDDVSGHGTHVAGIIAAKTNNGRGIAGVCPDCQLINAKVLRDDKSGNVADVVEGMKWAVDQGAKVINLSLTGDESANMQILEDAVNDAWNAGVVVVVAAGNNGSTVKTYPAAYENAIAVAATNKQDKLASAFSNKGADWVDVAAPGEDIWSTSPLTNPANEGQKKEYASLDGTSMASPFVAGIAALVYAKNAGATAGTVRTILEESVDEIEGTGQYWKYGRVNAATAVGAERPEETPTPTGTLTPTPTQTAGIPPCPTTTTTATATPTGSGNTPTTEPTEKDNKKKKKKNKKNNKKDKNKGKNNNKKKKGNRGKAKEKHTKSSRAATGNKNKSVKSARTLLAQANQTATPTSSPTTTPTPDCEPPQGDGTVLAMSIGLHGIGRGGDNLNPQGTGNPNPVSPDRDVFIDVFDINNSLVASLEGIITYDRGKGLFTGDIDAEIPSDGDYLFVITSPTYLSRRVINLVPLKDGETNTIPTVKLVTGDVNDDNVLNIFDFNIVTACIGVSQPSPSVTPRITPRTEATERPILNPQTPAEVLPLAECTEQDEINADLDDNGKVDRTDLNLWLRELSARPGE